MMMLKGGVVEQHNNAHVHNICYHEQSQHVYVST